MPDTRARTRRPEDPAEHPLIGRQELADALAAAGVPDDAAVRAVAAITGPTGQGTGRDRGARWLERALTLVGAADDTLALDDRPSEGAAPVVSARALVAALVAMDLRRQARHPERELRAERRPLAAVADWAARTSAWPPHVPELLVQGLTGALGAPLRRALLVFDWGTLPIPETLWRPLVAACAEHQQRPNGRRDWGQERIAELARRVDVPVELWDVLMHRFARTSVGATLAHAALTNPATPGPALGRALHGRWALHATTLLLSDPRTPLDPAAVSRAVDEVRAADAIDVAQRATVLADLAAGRCGHDEAEELLGGSPPGGIYDHTLMPGDLAPAHAPGPRDAIWAQVDPDAGEPRLQPEGVLAVLVAQGLLRRPTLDPGARDRLLALQEPGLWAEVLDEGVPSAVARAVGLDAARAAGIRLLALRQMGAPGAEATAVAEALGVLHAIGTSRRPVPVGDDGRGPLSDTIDEDVRPRAAEAAAELVEAHPAVAAEMGVGFRAWALTLPSRAARVALLAAMTRGQAAETGPDPSRRDGIEPPATFRS